MPATTTIAGLIGDPVEHSLSPHMHNAAFQSIGLDARYELWPTAHVGLGPRVTSLRRENIVGANITVPHKQAVMPLLDGLSDRAMRIGAVNTIVARDGQLHGDNTDAYGFNRSMAEATGHLVPASALVVGAGGAARAVLVSLQDAGVAVIILVNRSQITADALAGSLNAPGRPVVQVRPWNSMPRLAASAAMLVNATSVGWHGEELPFGMDVIAALPDDAVAMDLTYRSTAMVRAALARGLRGVDGLSMLIYQGARAFELWTGQPAPVDVMRRAVLAEQARRS